MFMVQVSGEKEIVEMIFENIGRVLDTSKLSGTWVLLI